MASNLLFRRLITPILLIIFCAALLIAVCDSVWPGSLLFVGSASFVAAIASSVLLAIRYSREQARVLMDSVSQALGQDAPQRAAPLLIDEAIATVSNEVASAITHASTDKAQLMTIISSMSEGLIAIDHRQRILLTNRAAEQLLGLSPDATGALLWEAVKLPQIPELVSQVKLTGRRQMIDVGPIDGRFLEITVARLSADRYPGLIIVAHDVTEARKYEELRKEFVANVSHELRTPLTVIMGFVETLQDGALQDPETAGRFLGTVARHTGQLRNLVDDLLDLSRLDSEEHLPAREPTDIGAVARRVIDLLLPKARGKEQNLTSAIDEGLPKVSGNADLLQRAVANLVDNALKYTPVGGKVTVACRQEGGHVVIAVSDTGIGIDAEHLPRIFERFYRVDKSRSREMGGTGLGLSIVKHVVQAHDGQIDVDSEPGKGSTFSIRVPTIAKPASLPEDAVA